MMTANHLHFSRNSAMLLLHHYKTKKFFVTLLFGKEFEFHLYFHSNVHFMF